MPITEKQREARRKHLGSSDVAAVLGLDPWRNAYDVWLEKTGQIEDDKDKNYQGAGNIFEPGVISWAEEELGPIITEINGEAIFREAIGFPIASHPDGLTKAAEEPVEAKTAGLFGPLVEIWGDPGTDQLPDRIIIQTHVHMLCTDKPVCYVPTFLGGRGFQMFTVERDKEIMDAVCDQSMEFWNDYVLKQTPPPDIMPTLPVIKRMKREPEKVVDIPEAVVTNWLNAKESLKMAQEMKDGAETELLTQLGDAEAGQCGLGMITYFEQTQRRIDSKRLKQEKPELAAKYLKLSTFRVVRLKKPKKPKI